MTLLFAIAAALNAISAVLAWLAKIRWSKEYREAKEAQIDSLKTQAENIRRSKDDELATVKAYVKQLEELNPIRIREWTIKLKEQLEEYIEKLSQELSEAKVTIDSLNREISTLRNKEEAAKAILLGKQSAKQIEAITRYMIFDSKALEKVFGKELELWKWHVRKNMPKDPESE